MAPAPCGARAGRAGTRPGRGRGGRVGEPTELLGGRPHPPRREHAAQLAETGPGAARGHAQVVEELRVEVLHGAVDVGNQRREQVGEDAPDSLLGGLVGASCTVTWRCSRRACARPLRRPPSARRPRPGSAQGGCAAGPRSRRPSWRTPREVPPGARCAALRTDRPDGAGERSPARAEPPFCPRRRSRAAASASPAPRRHRGARGSLRRPPLRAARPRPAARPQTSRRAPAGPSAAPRRRPAPSARASCLPRPPGSSARPASTAPSRRCRGSASRGGPPARRRPAIGGRAIRRPSGVNPAGDHESDRLGHRSRFQPGAARGCAPAARSRVALTVTPCRPACWRSTTPAYPGASLPPSGEPAGSCRRAASCAP